MVPRPQEGKEYLPEIDGDFNDNGLVGPVKRALNTLIRDYNKRMGEGAAEIARRAISKNPNRIPTVFGPLPQPQESEHDDKLCEVSRTDPELVRAHLQLPCPCKCHKTEKPDESWQKGYEAGKREERERIVRVVFGYPPLDEKLTLDLIREIQDSVDD